MKRTGMMEIAFTNGVVNADAKTGMIDLKSMEKVGNMFIGLINEKEEGYKRLKEYLKLDQTKELITKLEHRSSLDSIGDSIDGYPSIAESVKPVFPDDARNISNETITNSEHKVFYKTGTKRYQKTWGDLILAVDFAMWLNVDFKIEVIETFIKGKILDFRILGVDHFKALNNLIDTLEDRVGKESNKGCYIQISKAINTRINGEFIKGWDCETADKDKQALRTRILDMSEQVMRMGMITTYPKLKEFIVNFK